MNARHHQQEKINEFFLKTTPTCRIKKLGLNAMCDYSQIPGFWLRNLAKQMKLNEKPGILAFKLHIA
jgi:hypothetical protein